MKKEFFVLLLLALNFNILAANFILCKSQYALCTTAKCTPMSGQKGIVSCHCTVKTGYSVGMKSCQPVKKIDQGLQINSRYYPIKGYVVCSNKRPWAWCLDKTCMIDKKDPAKAACACSIVKNLGDYIIVTSSYKPALCNSDLYSSALVTQANQITNFLKTQTKLKPFLVKVYQ